MTLSRKQRSRNGKSGGFRTLVGTGRRLHATGDGRTVWGRRFKEIHHSVTSTLGREPTTVDDQTIRRASGLTILLERLDIELASGREIDANLYGQLSDRLNRCWRRLFGRGALDDRVAEVEDDEEPTDDFAVENWLADTSDEDIVAEAKRQGKEPKYIEELLAWAHRLQSRAAEIRAEAALPKPSKLSPYGELMMRRMERTYAYRKGDDEIAAEQAGMSVEDYLACVAGKPPLTAEEQQAETDRMLRRLIHHA